MSLTTSSSFNPVLSEALNKIGENRFVGTQIMPVREVPFKNGDYPVFDSDQFDLNASEVRSAGSAFPRRDFNYTKQSYACVQYALEGVLPDEDASEANDDGISDAAGAIAQKLQRDLMVGHEVRVAAALAGAGFTTAATTAALSSASTATPIKDIQGAVEGLNANGFFDNVTLVMEQSIYNELLNTDDVRNIFNGNGTYVDLDILKAATGVNNIIVCPTRFNSADKGAAASRTKIWSTSEYYVLSIAGGDFANGGFGRTLAYPDGGGVFTAETYRDEPIKSDVLRVYNTVDEVIINSNAGQKLSADS
jgi:hypothetical protein